jgi:hypothetical protein
VGEKPNRTKAKYWSSIKHSILPVCKYTVWVNRECGDAVVFPSKKTEDFFVNMQKRFHVS